MTYILHTHTHTHTHTRTRTRTHTPFILTVDMEVKFVLAAKLQFARAGVSKDRPLCTPWTVAALADHVAVVCSLVLFRVQGLGVRV